MNRDLLKTAEGGNALLSAAKIERAFQTQGTQNLDIGLGKVAEMIGAEDLPPADSPAIPGGIAPEVAEIAGAGEIEVTGRCVGHGVSLRHPLRRRNDGRAYRLSGWLWSIVAVSKGANMNWCKAITIFGAATLAAGLASGSSPAFAQTFQNYRCADGSHFIVGFFPYDRRAHLQIDGKAVTLGRRLALSAIRAAVSR